MVESELFDRAKRRTIRAYQSLIVNDYLKRLTNESNHFEYSRNGRASPPIEWQGTIKYIFLTEARESYPLKYGGTWSLGEHEPGSDILSSEAIDLGDYFKIGNKSPFFAKALDTKIEKTLSSIGKTDTKRNAVSELLVLDRYTYQLASGQQFASYFGLEEIPLPEILTEQGVTKTPLLYYILQEAELRENGARLGDIGSAILSAAIESTLSGDPESILNKPEAARRYKENFIDINNFIRDYR